MADRPAVVRPFSVVILTCGRLGAEVAARCAELDMVTSVSVAWCPWRSRKLSLIGKIRHVYRRQGPTGLFRVAWSKIAGSPETREIHGSEAIQGVVTASFADFHDAACVDFIRAQQPDLGVVVGTYILKAEVFELPRLGSVNLHSGKVPEYRGSAPAFWELYNGETEVGITIHQVETELDAGPIFKQTIVPLDPAPAGDPMRYIAAYRRDQLLPRGVELLVETVSEIASGGAVSAPQAVEAARTYPYPDYRAVKALRRRVQRRQTQRSAT